MSEPGNVFWVALEKSLSDSLGMLVRVDLLQPASRAALLRLEALLFSDEQDP